MRRLDIYFSSAALTGALFLAGIFNYLSQIVLGRCLHIEEFGEANTALSYLNLLVLPLTAVSTTLCHYISKARHELDAEGIHTIMHSFEGLLIKCSWVSMLIVLLAGWPLAKLLNFDRDMMIASITFSALVMLWVQYVGGTLSGMALFEVIALMQLSVAVLRLAGFWGSGWVWPSAEMAVLSAGVAALIPYLVGYRIMQKHRPEVAKEKQALDAGFKNGMIKFFLLCIGSAFANYMFLSGDLLVAQKKLSPEEVGYYSAAGIFARAIVFFSLPALSVLFTSISENSSRPLSRQHYHIILLFIIAVAGGACTIILLRSFLLDSVLKVQSPEAESLLVHFSLNMVGVALLHLMAAVAMACRNYTMIAVFFIISAGYLVSAMRWVESPQQLLSIMSVFIAMGLFSMILSSQISVIVNKAVSSARGFIAC